MPLPNRNPVEFGVLEADVKKMAKDLASMEPLASGGGGGDNGNMEPRVKALEDGMAVVGERLARIETRLENMPTKADLEALRADIYGKLGSAINSQTWRIFGASTTLVAIVYFVAKNVH